MLHRNNGRERQTETEEKKGGVSQFIPDKITSAVDPNRQTVGVVDNSSMCIK